MIDNFETEFHPAARPARTEAAKHVPLLVAVLLAALTLAPAAADEAATTDALLSNVGQPRRSSLTFQSFEHAQGFTTGPNLKGYALANIEIGFLAVDGGGSITVSVWSDSGGKPGSKLFDLTNPTAFTGDKMHRFAAPSDTVLTPRTAYHLHIVHAGSEEERSATAFRLAKSSGKDEGGAPGWGFDNRISRRYAHFNYTEGSGTIITNVNGSAVPPDPATQLVSNLQQTPPSSSVNLRGTPEQAQGFTTGSARDGYVLAHVEIDFDDVRGGDSVVVSLWSDRGGKPERKLFDLSNPAGFSGRAVHRFTAPPNTVLAPSSTYYVHVTHSGDATAVDGTAVDRASSAGEDTGGMADWSIADQNHYRARPNFQFSRGASVLLIKVSGSNAPAGSLVTPTLKLGAETIGEDGGETTVTAVLSRASTTDTTITVGATPVSPATDADYTQSGTTLTISAGSTTSTGTVTIAAVDNDVDAADKEVTVAATATGVGVAAPADRTLTITDDDTRGVTVSESSLEFGEGGSATYTVVLDSQPTAQVTVGVAFASGADSDLTVDDATLTFSAADWHEAQTVEVRAAEDTDDVHDVATVQHTVSGGDYGANSVSAADVSVTVTDNESPSTRVVLAANPETVAEDVGAAGQEVTVTATLNAAPRATDTEVTLTVAPDTATAADYAAVTGFTLTIEAQATSATGTFTLKPVDDRLSEGGETVAVSGVATNNLAVTGATVAITDNEALPTVTLTLGAPSISERGGETTVTATLDHGSAAETTVTVAATPVSPASGSDYTLNGSTLTISAGSTTSTGTVTIGAVDNGVNGADKQVTVSATAANHIGVTGPADRTLTITDDEVSRTTVNPPDDTGGDDPPPPPQVSIEDASAREGSGVMAFTVRLGAASEQPVSMSWMSADGTATAAADYAAVTDGTLTFAPGQTRQTIRVDVLDDRLDESDETFVVRLSNPVNARLDPHGSAATGTIVDDDATPGLTIADARAVESGGEIAFLVTLEAASGRPVSVVCSTTDETATVDEDYLGERGVLTFAPGETQRTIRITVLDDTRQEKDETFMLDLSEPTNARMAADVIRATGTIADDDRQVTVAWLARFGRTVTNEVLDSIVGRLEGGYGAGTHMTLAGHRLQAVQPAADGEDQPAPAAVAHRTISGRELLAGSGFQLEIARSARPEVTAMPPSDAAEARWTAWGRGAATHFEGRDGRLSMQGEVLTGSFGIDRRHGAVLAGLAVARSGGAGGYAAPGGDDRPAREGDLRAELTSLHPYARVSLNERVQVWGVLGYGMGTLELREADQAEKTGISMLLGAFGGRAALLTGEWSGVRLALKTDGYLSRMTSEATAALPVVEAYVSRLRLAAEGSTALDLGARRVLMPSLEVGVRHDGGDAETGAGLETAAALRWFDPAWGLTLAAGGRVLLTHQDRGYREWGAGGSLHLDPGAAGRGPALTADSSYGAPAAGAGALWSLRDASGLAVSNGAEARAGRVAAELSYGVELPGGGRVVPYAGAEMTDRDRRTWRLGSRISPGGFDVAAEVARRDRAGAAPMHSLTLNASVRL